MIVKGGRPIYGEAIGICIVDKSGPLLPGNVGNSSTYDFPVRIKIVKGLKDSPFLPIRDDSGRYTKDAQLFIDALKELELEGVRAITGACGFFSLFQKEAVKLLKIPFFSSMFFFRGHNTMSLVVNCIKPLVTLDMPGTLSGNDLF